MNKLSARLIVMIEGNEFRLILKTENIRGRQNPAGQAALKGTNVYLVIKANNKELTIK
jgi:hypothetical protein